ncbi:MAG: helix-turn-helix domain-containing protein, partial [Cognatishimia sp.]|uniref:helix-turn-helix domain-containing protein n=1 Tax=Cognatishimia sp. TaxID=2211648 RepID=UPI004058FFC1
MIGRKKRKAEVKDTGPKGFDDYDVSLGDLMRGERATMGKSLLDVQRELRIRASYIAAIENADPSAFETPGFIAGYVRSYARYLNMNPEDTFEKFCIESGFQTAHGMAAEASTMRKSEATVIATGSAEPLQGPGNVYVSSRESFFTNLEPRALASSLVLLAL